MATSLPTGIRTAVDPNVVKAALEELKGSSSAALNTVREGIESTLSSVFDAAGDDLDLTASAVTQIEGFTGSVADNATKVVELHSRLSAVEQLSSKHSAVEMVRAEIQAGREGAERSMWQRGDNTLRREVRQAMLSDTLLAHVRKEFGQSTTVMDAFRKSGGQSMLIESNYDTLQYLAAVVTTAAGWDPFVTRQPGHTPAISRPLQVYQTLPMSMTNEHSIKYMLQTTRTASAVVNKAEGAASGEAVMEWTERTEDMREIPGHIPVTEIQMEDEPQVRAIIDTDLRLMVMQQLDGQLITGNGTAPNISGMGDTRNSVTPVEYNWAVSGSARSDQIDDMKKAKTSLILTGRVQPNVAYLHHEIWDEIALSETTSAGYYLGSPASDFVERVWGLPVVLTDHLDSGVTSGDVGGFLADTMYLRLWVRRGIHSEVGLSGTDFVKRQLTIRAAIRACLQARRVKAVCELSIT